MSFLIDTNVISELVKAKPNRNVLNWFAMIPDISLYISVLSLGEIRKGIESMPKGARKIKLQSWLEHELAAWFGDRVLTIDQAVAERWGKLQANLQRPLPIIDSLISATALHYDLALVTRNIKDFSNFDLEVINPWEFNHQEHVASSIE
jgi:toxin FitB